MLSQMEVQWHATTNVPRAIIAASYLVGIDFEMYKIPYFKHRLALLQRVCLSANLQKLEVLAGVTLIAHALLFVIPRESAFFAPVATSSSHNTPKQGRRHRQK